MWGVALLAYPGYSIGVAEQHDTRQGKEVRLVAELPPSLLPETVVVPMTANPQGIFCYLGDGSLSRPTFGGRIEFLMSVIGTPGQTLAVYLVQLTERELRQLRLRQSGRECAYFLPMPGTPLLASTVYAVAD